MNQTTQRTPKLHRFSDLRGRKVLDNSGEEIGTVQDLFVDEEEKELRYLDVRWRLSGPGRPYVRDPTRGGCRDN